MRKTTVLLLLLMVWTAPSVEALLEEPQSDMHAQEIIRKRQEARAAEQEYRERVRKYRQEMIRRIRSDMERPPWENEHFKNAGRRNGMMSGAERSAGAASKNNPVLDGVAIGFAVLTGILALLAWYFAHKERREKS
jgi:hypothetical protein